MKAGKRQELWRREGRWRVRAASALVGLCALSALTMAQDGKSGVGGATGPLQPPTAPDPSRGGAGVRRVEPSGGGQPETDPNVARFQDRLIREIKVVGLKKVPEQEVMNQVRSRTGAPLSAETVLGDVQRLNRLGKFNQIKAKIQPFEDGSIALTYEFGETQVIEDVQAVGNRQINDGDIAAEVSLLKGTPVDEFQLGNAANRIKKLYRDKGYYQAEVTVDQTELEKNSIVLFKISEGERLRVTDIRFEGNGSFSARELLPVVKTKVAGLFESGPVDNEQLSRDVASIIAHYKDRGYLDVRADKRLTFAPNGREAIVVFIVDEGKVYTLRSVRVEKADPPPAPPSPPGAAGGSGAKPAPRGPTATEVLSREQVAGLMEIKAGDVYSVDKIRTSVDTIQNAYLRMGYVDVGVQRLELRDPARPEVDLLLRIREGSRYRTGLILTSGNDITQKKVLLRELDIRPDRPLNMTVRRIGSGDTGRLMSESEVRLNDARLFEPGSVKVTIQEEDPENPGHRDVLVEVRETNTGRLSFGAGLSSDNGVFGLIQLNQRNFDVADLPESWDEFFSGRAFRGAGQTFNITLAPGTELQTYGISLSDPNLFDTDYSGSISGEYRQREYDDYDEDRLSARLGVGRRFGDLWTGSVSMRAENVDIHDIDDDAPVDIFDVEGKSQITGVGFRLVRNTLDSRFKPTRGTRIELGVEGVGLLGGDYNFTKLSGEHQLYLPVYEDFVGRKTVFSTKIASSYIPEGQEETPIFERYFLGGRSLRGFDFRTVSPKGLRRDGSQSNDPVGGTWMFFAGCEIEQPIYEDIISVVAFVDSGTVEEDFGFDKYRLSAGFGLRLSIPLLSPTPFAFDFGFPILKYFGDKERVFSFSVDLPF